MLNLPLEHQVPHAWLDITKTSDRLYYSWGFVGPLHHGLLAEDSETGLIRSLTKHNNVCRLTHERTNTTGHSITLHPLMKGLGL